MAKPPPVRSVSDQYRYIRPGESPDGRNGVDYLLVEQALIAHYQQAYIGFEKSNTMLDGCVSLRRKCGEGDSPCISDNGEDSNCDRSLG